MRTPEAVKGARCLRVHWSEVKSLDSEDGPHRLVSEGKECRRSGYRSMPLSCAVCTVGAGLGMLVALYFILLEFSKARLP